MKKYLFPLILIVMLIFALCAYASDVRRDLSESLVRLHVIAASDSDYDQNIKLAVRDAILSATQELDKNDPNGFAKAAEAAANEYLKSHSVPYLAHAEYGRFDFPEKEYQGFTLPAGEYNGVRVILGSGEGHNWWCILYPPMCFDGDAEELQRSLRPDTYDVISSPKREVRFRIAELLGL